jgi:hypothetical protein
LYSYNPNEPRIYSRQSLIYRVRNFRMAVELLEAIADLEQDPANQPWIWTFRTGQPLLAIAIVLSYLCSAHPDEYTERAWAQVRIAFKRNVDVDRSLVPIIAALEALRDTAEQSRLPVQELDMLELVDEPFQFPSHQSGRIAAGGANGLTFTWPIGEFVSWALSASLSGY